MNTKSNTYELRGNNERKVLELSGKEDIHIEFEGTGSLTIRLTKEEKPKPQKKRHRLCDPLRQILGEWGTLNARNIAQLSQHFQCSPCTMERVWSQIKDEPLPRVFETEGQDSEYES